MEWEPTFLDLGLPPDSLGDVVVERNGEPLAISARELGGKVRVVAEWPRSTTGRYELVVRYPPGQIAETVVVTVWPAKLSQVAYSRLLDDLEFRLPASIAVDLSMHGALSGIELLPPADSTFEQELLRVRRAVRGNAGRPGLAAALQHMAGDPHSSLVSSDVWVPRERVRRIDPARLAQLLTRGGNLASDGRPLRVPEVRVEHTADVYENRLVRSFCDQVVQRIRVLREVNPSGSAYDELVALEDILLRARRDAGFLDDVGQLVRAPSDVTMVLLKRPDYRAALEGFLEFRRSSVVRLDEPALESPLRNLPWLYETWGILQLIHVVLTEAPKYGYELRSDRIIVRDPSGLFLRVLRKGEAALTFEHADGTVLKVIPQRRYGKSGALRSISFPQVPDAAVELSWPDGRIDVWVFDPKYKLDSEDSGAPLPDGRPIKEDIDKMHAYRDAIRDSSGRAAVQFAAILYPGPSEWYSDAALAAIRAHPEGCEELHNDLRTVIDSCMTAEGRRGEIAV